MQVSPPQGDPTEDHRRQPETGGLGRPGPWSPAHLSLGLVTSMAGLARLAIAGFAPRGHLAIPVLAACAAGLTATLLTGRAWPGASAPYALDPQIPDQPPQAA